MDSNPTDIFDMLDKASVFSGGKQLKQDVDIKNKNIKKPTEKKINNKNNNLKHNNKSAEEIEYAKIIGYELSDDDGDDKFYFDDHYNYESDDETVEDSLARTRVNFIPTKRGQHAGMHVGRNGYKHNDFQPQQNGVGLGRGKLLKTDYGNVLSLTKLNKPPPKLRPSRQEQNDRVISEQLREVIGCGTSNEEIEDAFTKRFKKIVVEEKPAATEVTSKTDDDSSSVASCDSRSSQKRQERSIYVPPPLRSIKKDEDLLGGRTDGSADSIISETYRSITFHRPPSPSQIPVSKVKCIYDIDDDDDDDDDDVGDVKEIEKYFNDSNSDDCEIIEVKEEVLEETPKFGFKIRDKGKDSTLMKLGGGRNAMINAIMKKNAESLNSPPSSSVSPKLEEETEKQENVNDLKNNQDEYEEKVSDNYVTQDYSFSSSDQRDIENASFVSADSDREVKNYDDSFRKSNSRCNSRCSNISGSDNSIKNNELAPKKTYIESILQNSSKTGKKKGSFTLGDFLSPDSLNTSNSSVGSNLSLNPEAPAFMPSYLACWEKKDYDFRLNEDNFPPL